jgi:hypothetical protein
MKIRKSRWLTKLLRSPRSIERRNRTDSSRKATVPRGLLNVNFIVMVKDGDRFGDSSKWGHPGLHLDTVCGRLKLRTPTGAAPRITIDTFVQLVFLVGRGLIANVKASTSNSNRKSKVGDLTAAAERELEAFVSAVAESYGEDQARLATEDWLLELEMMDVVPEPSSGLWRTLTIVSASRLAARLNPASSDTKVSPVRSSNCLVSEPLA